MKEAGEKTSCALTFETGGPNGSTSGPNSATMKGTRKLDREDREEHESLVDLYLRAMESSGKPEVRAA